MSPAELRRPYTCNIHHLIAATFSGKKPLKRRAAWKMDPDEEGGLAT